MSKPSAPKAPSPHNIRRDGWTGVRQLRFLDALGRTLSVTRAAAFSGMSRESAYRLRARPDGVLFAAAWDRAMRRSQISQLRILRDGLAGRFDPRGAPTSW